MNTLDCIMQKCINDMLAVGIPVAKDNITGITTQKLNKINACCFYEDINGKVMYDIVVHDGVLKYIDDAVVMQNLKNSICHELLHTCPNCCEGHNDEFIKWSKICDEQLGTHTLRFMDRKIYYNTYKGKIFKVYCPVCGFEHWYSKELNYDIQCDTCNSIFLKK